MKVDLNTATVENLDTLPGVGPVLAGRIVAWRSANGRFRSVDELAEVAGIGEAILSQIRDLVRV
jgi:competence protein ComEA